MDVINSDDTPSSKVYDISSVKHRPVTLSYGLISKDKYEHISKNCNIQSVTYNSKTCDYVIVDSRGITAWTKSFAIDKTTRLLEFPAYKFNVINILLYCRQLNLYFALTKDYQLKIYNLNFHETFSIESDTKSLIHMQFNGTTGELITASRTEISTWEFGEISKPKDSFKANYGLLLKSKWAVDHGRLLNRMSLDEDLQRLYCLSEADIFCHELDGRQVFAIKRASSSHLSACAYARTSHSVIAGSIDGQINILTTSGGKIHTFYSHSSLVTEIIIHPSDGNLFITSSLDGNIKIFSLDILEELYSLKVFTNGIDFMALRSKDLLYCASSREIEIFSLNYLCRFWGRLRYPAQRIELLRNAEKPNRVMALDKNGSVKLFSCKDGRKLCTVLPPPVVDPLSKVLACVHDRDYNLVYLLVSAVEVWVYTTKTDPACFLAAVNLREDTITSGKSSRAISSPTSRTDVSAPHAKINCSCLEVLGNFVKLEFVDNDGNLQTSCSLLACGMDSGEIILYNPLMNGRKEKSIPLCKDPIVDLRYHRENCSLLVTILAKEGLVIKLFSKDLEALVSVSCEKDITCYQLKGDNIVAGFSSGHVIVKEVAKQSKMELSKTTTDHQAEVLSVSFHPTLDVCSSSGKDHCVKLWSLDKNLLCEIDLDVSLTSACFLNGSGDIIMGFKGHIFIIRNEGKFEWLSNAVDSESKDGRPETGIYEGRYVKYELKRPLSVESENMENYLVPYQDMMFSTIGSWVVNQDDNVSDSRDSDQDISGQILSDDDSCAPSDIYQSSIFSTSSRGSRFWGLPDCGLTPEGSVVESESEEEVIIEVQDEEKEEPIQKPHEDRQSKLKELLAQAEEKSSSVKEIKFTHGATKKLKNARIDSKKLKASQSVQSQKREEGSDEKPVNAAQNQPGNIPKGNVSKRVIVKKTKKVRDRKRKGVQEKADETSKGGEAEEKAAEEISNDVTSPDGGYVSPASEANNQPELIVESPLPVEYGVSLTKGRLRLIKSAASAIDGEILEDEKCDREENQKDEAYEEQDGAGEKQDEAGKDQDEAGKEPEEEGEELDERPRVSSTQFGSDLYDFSLDDLDQDPYNLSPDDPEDDSYLVTAESSPLWVEINQALRSKSPFQEEERREENVQIAKSREKYSKSIHPSQPPAKWYSDEANIPKEEIVKTKVVPAFSQAPESNLRGKNGTTMQTRSVPLAALSLRTEKVVLRDSSARRREPSPRPHSPSTPRPQDQSRASSRQTIRQSKGTKSIDEVKLVTRKTSQALRVNFGDIQDGKKFISSRSIKLRNERGEINESPSEEQQTDNLMKFCLSALKKKKRSVIRGPTNRVMSAEHKVVDKDEQLSRVVYDDERPRTAPYDVPNSAERWKVDEGSAADNEGYGSKTLGSQAVSKDVSFATDLSLSPNLYDSRDDDLSQAQGTKPTHVCFSPDLDDKRDTDFTQAQGTSPAIPKLSTMKEPSGPRVSFSPELRYGKDDDLSKRVFKGITDSAAERDFQLSVKIDPKKTGASQEIGKVNALSHKSTELQFVLSKTSFSTDVSKRTVAENRTLSEEHSKPDLDGAPRRSTHQGHQPGGREMRNKIERDERKPIYHSNVPNAFDIHVHREAAIDIYKKARMSLLGRNATREKDDSKQTHFHLKDQGELSSTSLAAKDLREPIEPIIRSASVGMREESFHSEDLLSHTLIDSLSHSRAEELVSKKNERSQFYENAAPSSNERQKTKSVEFKVTSDETTRQKSATSKYIFVNMPSEKKENEELPRSSGFYQYLDEDLRSLASVSPVDITQINLSEVNANDLKEYRRLISRVPSPQDKLLQRRALSARLKERQISTKFRRGVIQNQRIARAQSGSVSLFAGPDYPLEFLPEKKDDAGSTVMIYEYKKPVPLLNKSKKLSNGKLP